MFYKISTFKERVKRSVIDILSRQRFSKITSDIPFPVVAKGHMSPMMRKLNGVDMNLQRNKIVNIKIACAKINGIIVFPGEIFSFWKLVGNTKKSIGYLPGLTISGEKLGEDIGGGLCQLANMIHWLILHTPMTITEFHHHTDALFPDSCRRVPFGTGTSILYNYIDYRFKNDTQYPIQLRVWVDDDVLYGEVLCEEAFQYKYRIEEEDHHFAKEGNHYFRNSKIYRKIIDVKTRNIVGRDLILVNHAQVMYDHNLIPKEQIRELNLCI